MLDAIKHVPSKRCQLVHLVKLQGMEYGELSAVGDYAATVINAARRSGSTVYRFWDMVVHRAAIAVVAASTTKWTAAYNTSLAGQPTMPTGRIFFFTVPVAKVVVRGWHVGGTAVGH